MRKVLVGLCLLLSGLATAARARAQETSARSFENNPLEDLLVPEVEGAEREALARVGHDRIDAIARRPLHDHRVRQPDRGWRRTGRIQHRFAGREGRNGPDQDRKAAPRHAQRSM